MWLAVVCLLVVLISKLFLDYRRPFRFPPGPRGLPLIGNILDVKKLVKETKFFGHAMCRLGKMYGPVVGLRLGFAEPIILVSGKDAINEMLSRPEFDGRPNGFSFKYRSGGKKRGVIFTDGDLWNHQKRFTLKTLRRFGFGKVTVEQALIQEAICLTRVLSREAEKGPINNFHHFNSIAVLNSLWYLVAGQRFNVEEEHPELTEILTILHDTIRNTNVAGGLVNAFPFLRHMIPGLIGFKASEQRLQRITRYFTNVISEGKRSRVDKEHRHFIDAYLAEIDAQKINSTISWFNEDQLINTVKDLFSAGVETTNNAIGFTITYLAIYQKTQEKVHDEINTVLGKTALPTLQDRLRMPYLNATLAESMRLANIAPTTIAHRALTTAELCGFEIKKNYTMLANLRSIHMDEDHWGDPKVFRPERFLDSKGQFVEDPWVIPFGLGRRRCLGETLAKNTIFLYVAYLMQKFHFDLVEEHSEVCLDGIDGFSVGPPHVSFILTDKNSSTYCQL